MPVPTPFHPRTSKLSESKEWREWPGYWSAVTYEHTHLREYFAIRNSAALIDVSPLFNYDITGPQAAAVVDRIVPRDMTHCKISQILYSPRCDDDGKIVDDGTVWRLAEDRFRITAADPSRRGPTRTGRRSTECTRWRGGHRRDLPKLSDRYRRKPRRALSSRNPTLARPPRVWVRGNRSSDGRA